MLIKVEYNYQTEDGWGRQVTGSGSEIFKVEVCDEKTAIDKVKNFMNENNNPYYTTRNIRAWQYIPRVIE